MGIGNASDTCSLSNKNPVSWDWEIWVGNGTLVLTIFHSLSPNSRIVFLSARWWLVVIQNFGDIFIFHI